MNRYYAVLADVDPGRLVHLSFTSRESNLWPHTLCNLQAHSDAPDAEAPTCITCIGVAQDYDQRLREAHEEGFKFMNSNPCAEIWLDTRRCGHG